jgi:ribosomal protein S1
MSEKYFRGKITFINNDSQKATIEYISNNKIKSIQAIVDDIHQERMVAQRLIKKPHRFLIGDNVKFVIKKSSANVFFADQVIFEFNNAIDLLIDKSRIANKFLGYIKVVEDNYFIKEIESYLFFPLQLSKFEIPPVANESDKAVAFKLLNIEKPEKLKAELYNHNYIPGFKVAVKQHKSEEAVDAVVTKITPYGVFVVLTESKLEAKLPVDEMLSEKINKGEIGLDKSIAVKIKHLTSERIVIEMI